MSLKLILSILFISFVAQSAYTPLTTLNPETTKVIGTVNISAGQTLTCNAGTGTQAVSLATIPLATNASTAAWQASSDASLTTLVSRTPALGQALAASSTPVVLPAIQVASMATSANQTSEIAILSFLDSSLTDIASAIGTDGSPPNFLRNIVAGWDGTNVRTLKTDSGGELQIDVLSSALPSGAATSAWQVSSDASINSLLKPASTLAAVTTVGTITNPVTVNSHAVTNAGIFAVQATLASETTKVIGTVNVAASQTIGISAGSAVIGHVITDSGSTTAVTGNVAITAAALPLPSGAATSAWQVSSDSSLTSIKTAVETIDNMISGSGVNISQINGVTPLMGTGPVGTGSPRVNQANIATATLANVASSATSVTLQASNANRMKLILYNDSTSVLYLKYGATASATSFTYYILPGGTWEMPLPIYSGIVDGIWASANGNARMTEL